MADVAANGTALVRFDIGSVDVEPGSFCQQDDIGDELSGSSAHLRWRVDGDQIDVTVASRWAEVRETSFVARRDGDALTPVADELLFHEIAAVERTKGHLHEALLLNQLVLTTQADGQILGGTFTGEIVCTEGSVVERFVARGQVVVSSDEEPPAVRAGHRLVDSMVTPRRDAGPRALLAPWEEAPVTFDEPVPVEGLGAIALEVDGAPTAANVEALVDLGPTPLADVPSGAAVQRLRVAPVDGRWGADGTARLRIDATPDFAGNLMPAAELFFEVASGETTRTFGEADVPALDDPRCSGARCATFAGNPCEDYGGLIATLPAPADGATEATVLLRERDAGDERFVVPTIVTETGRAGRPAADETTDDGWEVFQVPVQQGQPTGIRIDDVGLCFQAAGPFERRVIDVVLPALPGS